MKVSKFFTFAMAAVALAFTSCGPKLVSVTGITIPETLAVDNLQPKEIAATVTPADATTKLVWKSSNESIVTVLSSGDRTAIVTYKGEGTAEITASADGVTSNVCVVTSKFEEGEVPPPGEGFVRLAIRVPEGTCNGLYAIGSFNGWTHNDAAYRAALQPGTDWQVITLPYDPDLMIKVCAIPESGSPDWIYQWGKNGSDDNGNTKPLYPTEGYNVTFVGVANGEFKYENGGQPRLDKPADNSVVFLDVKAWALAPCAPPIPGGNGTFTITITNYVDGTVIFTGNFPEKDWANSDRVMTKVGNTWTWTGDYPQNFQYKIFIQETNTWAAGDNAIFDGVTFTHEFTLQ